MPNRCCVPLCKGNYPNGPTVSVFSFPNNEKLKQEWLKQIQRKNFHPTKGSKVRLIIFLMFLLCYVDFVLRKL